MPQIMDQSTADGKELFISYSSADAGQVIFIADQLECAGIGVWLDRRKILGGSVYGSEIATAIKRCRMLVLMCSEASLRSRNVKQEILLAWRYQIPFLLLRLAPINFPEQVEYWLEGHQWIDVFDSSPEHWLSQVKQALRRIRSDSAMGCDLGTTLSTEDGNSTHILQPLSPNSLASLRAAAKFTDRIWPLPADLIQPTTPTPPPRLPARVRDLTAPADQAQHRYSLSSRVGLAVELDRPGHLLLLDEGTSGMTYCLCPSWFAPETRLNVGRTYLPQPGAPYSYFEVSGRPGREHLLAVVTDAPLDLDWMPTDPRTAARVINQTDVELLLNLLFRLEANRWTAFSTYFDVVAR